MASFRLRDFTLGQYLLFWLCVAFLIWFCYRFRFGLELIPVPPPPTIIVEDDPGGNPKPCIAYNPETFKWGDTVEECPKNYAYYAVYDAGGKNKSGPGRFVPLTGLCCRLPFDDILTDEHIYGVFDKCPDGSVVTSGSGACKEDCAMRCTRINTRKYQLAPETLAYYWEKEGTGRHFGRGNTEKMRFRHIPASLRYGVARQNHNHWRHDGCIGFPFGSLLTRKSRKRCDGFYFRQLQFLNGKPVKMLPDCDELEDYMQPEPKCIVKKKDLPE